jgi:hypothetical protein
MDPPRPETTPGRRDLEIVVAAVPPPARLLELGSGAGRLAPELVRRGYQVTSGDEQVMLPGTFDVVLVYSADPAVLAAARRHVDYDGQVLIRRARTDRRLAVAVSEAGLFVERYLTPDGTWMVASPRS